MTKQKRLLALFTSAPQAFFRFDVDLDLGAAVHMARFAQVAGISGTFYLNPRCDFYNLASRQGSHTLRAIFDAGHTVGLHCDYRGRGRVETHVQDDLELFSAAQGIMPDRVSFHMPSLLPDPPEVLWRDFASFENAYAAKWQGRYLSDSRGRWPLEREPTDDDQVCLHPEHHF